MIDRLPCYFLFCLLASTLFAATVYAQDPDDTRQLLEHSARELEQHHEQVLLEPALTEERPTFSINGKTYPIGHNIHDLGRALYLSLQQQRWNLAAGFLSEYLTLPGYDPALVHYAQGKLARAYGKYHEAVAEFRQLLALQPGFLVARLELARTLFEDYQLREADALFAGIAASVEQETPEARGMHKTIAAYRAALARRQEWTGSMALGVAWGDNINRTSASQMCLLMLPNGVCVIDRKLPDAIVANGYAFAANAQKYLPVSGHHGVYLHALGFGQGWRNHHLYNEFNAHLEAGYRYRNGRQTVMLAPAFYYYVLGNSALYAGLGIRGQWDWLLSPRAMWQLDADWKRMDYQQPAYAVQHDGIQRSAAVTYIKRLNHGLSVFAGLNMAEHAAVQAVNTWTVRGLRAGLSWQWPAGISQLLSVSARQRRYGAHNALLGARREDHERGVTLSLTLNRWARAGFVPVVTLRHDRVNSNVDWLYRYRRKILSLKMQRGF